MGKLLAVVGVVSSLLYLWLLWWLTEGRLTQLDTMTLNEVGDFLAGAFGPLAILWLVLGFFQQRAELRLSTEALKTQGEELKNSVAQQERLAELSLQSLQLEQKNRLDQESRFRASLRPVLSIQASHPLMINLEYSLSCKLINDGAQVYRLEVYLAHGEKVSYQGGCRVLEKSQSNAFTIKWDPSEAGKKLLLKIVYTEQDGLVSEETFLAIPGDEYGAIDFIGTDSSFIH